MATWSKEPPKEPGWYWMRKSCGSCGAAREATPGECWFSDISGKETMLARVPGRVHRTAKIVADFGWEYGPRIEPPKEEA